MSAQPISSRCIAILAKLAQRQVALDVQPHTIEDANSDPMKAQPEQPPRLLIDDVKIRLS